MQNNYHTLGWLLKYKLRHSVLTSEAMQNNQRYGSQVDESDVRFGLRKKHAAVVGFLLRRI